MPIRTRVFALCLGASPFLFAADNPAPAKQTKANYELAAQWTPAKMGKLVFDTSVTPHWLEQGDRFWYSFENSKRPQILYRRPGQEDPHLRLRPCQTRRAAHHRDRHAL